MGRNGSLDCLLNCLHFAGTELMRWIFQYEASVDGGGGGGGVERLCWLCRSPRVLTLLFFTFFP